ncbi:MAG: DUF1932 domain-containing protein [Clostridia bacterium]
MLEKLIVFIGFGEAAYHIAKGLVTAGLANITAYDVCKYDPKVGATIQARAKEIGVNLVDSVEEAVDSAKFILSLTSAKVAVKVAEGALVLLESGQVFLDLNSAAPMTKKKIAALPRKEGVLVCDATVMGPVPINGYKVPILLAGEGGKDFCEALTPYGMKLEVLDAPAGGAAAVKMLRSVFMKGLPQLLLECMLAAEKYGVLDKIIDSVDKTIGGKNVRQLANQLFTPTVVHATRRSSEMNEVISMLDDMGLESSMSSSSKSRLDSLAAMHIVDEIGIDANLDYQEIIRLILKHRS